MKFTTATFTVAALAASTAAFPMAHNGTATHMVTKTVRLEAGSPKPVTTPSASSDKLLKLIIENLEAGEAGTIQKRKLDAIENSLSSANAKKLSARQTEDLLSLLGLGDAGEDTPSGAEGLLDGLGGADGGDGGALGGLEDLPGSVLDLGSDATGDLGGLESSLGGLGGNPGGEGGDLGGLTDSVGGLGGGLEGLGGDSTGPTKEDGGNQLVPDQDGKQDNGKGPDLESITESLPKLSGNDKGKTPDVNGTISSLPSHKGKPEEGEGHKDKSKDGNDTKGKTDDEKAN
ncbi:unnamed protein product [Clonostachys solani]|uniref:Uncharacterized protein n=1 Tax=Clonostachys solani TaxID=160281 RepID=A0A9N9VU25_9HYPO|nr:unnamed protein product [Clonostachys solani]